MIVLFTKEIEQWAKYGEINKRLYCDRHGYDFHVFKKTLDSSRPPTWSKFLAVSKLLSSYDWVFCTDADSLVMNPTIRMDSFLDEKYDMVVGSDHNGINTGHLFIKRSDWSFDFLDRCQEQTQFIGVQSEMCDEQGAFRHLYEADKIKTLPQRQINSYRSGHGVVEGEFQFGDFIIHFAERHIDRKPFMRDYLVKASLML
jgi:mannan polymerase II complex MNN10 subunit